MVPIVSNSKNQLTPQVESRFFKPSRFFFHIHPQYTTSSQLTHSCVLNCWLDSICCCCIHLVSCLYIVEQYLTNHIVQFILPYYSSIKHMRLSGFGSFSAFGFEQMLPKAYDCEPKSFIWVMTRCWISCTLHVQTYFTTYIPTCDNLYVLYIYMCGFFWWFAKSVQSMPIGVLQQFQFAPALVNDCKCLIIVYYSRSVKLILHLKYVNNRYILVQIMLIYYIWGIKHFHKVLISHQDL